MDDRYTRIGPPRSCLQTNDTGRIHELTAIVFNDYILHGVGQYRQSYVLLPQLTSQQKFGDKSFSPLNGTIISNVNHIFQLNWLAWIEM